MITQKIKLRGLTCAGCVEIARQSLRGMVDVIEVKVEVSGAAEMKVRRIVETEEIQQALADTPYQLG